MLSLGVGGPLWDGALLPEGEKTSDVCTYDVFSSDFTSSTCPQWKKGSVQAKVKSPASVNRLAFEQW